MLRAFCEILISSGLVGFGNSADLIYRRISRTQHTNQIATTQMLLTFYVFMCDVVRNIVLIDSCAH